MARKKEKIAIENLNKVLEWGTEVLDKLGIDYMLTGGTLLGIYRDGTLMPHDYDVDVDILAEDIENIDEFLEKFREATGITDRERVVFRDNYFTAYYEFERDPKRIPFDVFLMFNKGNKRYKHFFNRNENPDKEKCLIWPERFYYKEDWEKIEYNGKEYNIPPDIEEWIEIFFGKKWKRRDTEWTWPLADNCYIFGKYKKWEK